MEEIIKWHKGDDPIDDGNYLVQYKCRNIEFFGSLCFINGGWAGSETLYIVAWTKEPKGIKDENEKIVKKCPICKRIVDDTCSVERVSVCPEHFVEYRVLLTQG